MKNTKTLKFWIKEIHGWSKVDDEGNKYQYSIIQNKGHNDMVLDSKLVEKVIMYCYWLQYRDGMVMEVDLDQLKSIKHSKENLEYAKMELENSEFSVSY